MRQWVRLLVASLLIFSSFTYIHEPHSKAATGEKFKILEIRDDWSATNRIDPGTTITSLSLLKELNTSQYEIKMMTVKELNASRFSLDGAFDAIVFDPSIFTGTDRYSITVSDTSKKHNTSKIENDITQLKANEILTNYIQKGLPVFLHADVLTHATSNFTSIFKPSMTSGAAIAYTDSKQVVSRLQSEKIERPRLSKVAVSQAGQSLTSVDKAAPASPDKPIDFNFTLDQTTANTRVQLYIDFNSNDQFEESEKVDEKPATISGSLSYQFDAPSYTGPRNWMIKVVSEDGLSDYKTGSFLMKDQVAQAKILQVTRSGSTGSINGFMSGTLLKQDGLYDFNVEVLSATTFNSDFQKKNLNTNYDMLIFGFQDSYGAAALSDPASNAILDFTNTGQGLMLTHDTIFRPAQSSKPELFWETKFADLAGQKNFTNMGYGAQRPSGQAVKQNAGVMTSYPFALADTVAIATTHNQYFGLDLEQPDLIPWYNIREKDLNTSNQSVGRTIGDARNHYYMYTKGNVTYSGAGHTTNFNQQQEKELFSNTMYRAFIGANHKPLIKNILPTDKSSYLENEPLTISYQVNDYDLQDRELKTRIYIDNEKVFENNNLKNNSFVSQSFESKLKGKTSVTIRIEAEDQRGAKTIETRTVQVVRPAVSAPFVLSRSIDPATIPNGETAEILYTIKTTPMKQQEAIGENGYIKGKFSVTMENILFNEKLPSNLEVISTSGLKDAIISGQSIKGYTPNIEYDEALDGIYQGQWVAKQSEITFKVKVKAKESAGIYTLDKKDNVLTSTKNVYKNEINRSDKLTTVNNDPQAFPTLGYALTPAFATSAKIPSVKMDITTPSYKVLPEINPTGSQYGTLKWSIVDPTIASIDEAGVIKPKKVGTTQIKLVVPVGNGKELTTTSDLVINDVFGGLIVRNVPDTLYVGETKSMTGLASMISGNETPIQWIITNDSHVKTNGLSKNTLDLTGKTPGTITVKAVVPAEAGSSTYLAQSTTYTIQVKLPELAVAPSNLELWVGSTQDVTATFKPNYPLPFTTSTLSSAIELIPTANGYTITGKTGTPNGAVEALLTLTDFPDTVAKTLVRVRENPINVTADDLIMTMKDENKRPLLGWFPETTTERFYRMEVTQGKEYVKVDPTGQALQPLRPGVARIKVIVLKENKDVLEVLKNDQKTPLSTTFKVTIGSDSGSTDLDGDVY
ncbi:hypothetical protein RSA11_11150 [Exiguobacterium indicum]|uniref:DUF5057 domain-containing protein n=1 Tax=Exiguobacterium indicum TaxID=296995 RepID=A0AAW3MB13_9BACL|nr:DUF5057 domain-containing protein [Exiguobacterium indicum]KTR26259.1 hypothetical protein RSA11_11150 [Exiguobacterium indicum]